MSDDNEQNSTAQHSTAKIQRYTQQVKAHLQHNGVQIIGVVILVEQFVKELLQRTAFHVPTHQHVRGFAGFRLVRRTRIHTTEIKK